MMNLKLFLILIGSFSLSASVYPQNDRVTLKMNNVTLEELIWTLQKHTDFVFMYGTEEIAPVKDLTLDVKDESVSDVLKSCLENTNLSFVISGNAIVIKRVETKQQQQRETISIRGVVKDDKGDPLPGVTVVEKGTTTGVITGRDGAFTFNTYKRDSVILVFSFIGMQRKEVLWHGQESLVVTLEEELTKMDEVIVTSYQTIRRENMAGSVSKVNSEDLVLDGTQTLEQALQGKLPGVVVTNTSGLVGTRQKTRVRGTSTLIGNQDPVWVVDGIIQEDPLPFQATELTSFGKDPDNIEVIRNFVGGSIAWLNPSDIGDVIVLKDASATALYGVKAANGVILITTKKGKTGRMSVGYSGNFSIGSKVTYDKMNLMNSKERIDVSREIYEQGYVSTNTLQPVGYQGLLREYLLQKISYEEFNAKVKRLEVVNTDWFDILFRNPFTQSHGLSVSGGSDQTNYYASFSVNSREGTAKGNGSKTYQGSLSISSVFRDALTINFRISGSTSETKGFVKIDPYKYASKTNRAIPCFDENGDLFYYTQSNGFQYNILNELANTGNENTTSSLNATLSLRFRMGKYFTLESALGYNVSSSHGESWATERTNYITAKRGYEYGVYTPTDVEYRRSKLPHGGELSNSDNRNMNYTWKNTVSYAQNFGKHLVTAVVGQEVRSNKYDGMSKTIYGYIPDRGKTIINPPKTIEDNLGTMIENTYQNNSFAIVDRKSNSLSYLAAMTYTFDERYVLNASVRGDASNRFGQDKSSRFQPVWSVGLRWNMGREMWLQGQEILNELSMRVSYGYQGNVVENVGPDLIAYMPSGVSGISKMTGEYLLKIRSLPNPTLRWEKNKTVNAGVDFSFFKNKITGSFDYYYKRGEDIIVQHQVPYENGVTSMTINGGTMENSGWDLGVSFVPVRYRGFVWSVTVNTSKNYNKLTSKLEKHSSWQNAVSGSMHKEGYPVSGFWAFRYTGPDPKDGSPTFDLTGSESDEAKLDATEFMKYAGKLDPDFTAGIGTNIRYKMFVMSANFNLSVGGKKFLAPMFDSDMINNTAYEYNNMPKDLVNRWRQPGDQTDIPSLSAHKKGLFKLADITEYGYRAYNFSDARVVKASFLRCNNISLSYTVPQGKLDNIFKSMSFNFSVSNPFIIVSSDYKGVDPEVATGSQPISRNYTFGVNVSF